MAARATRSAGAVRRRALRLLRELDVDAPLDLDVLCERLGAHRGRPVRLTHRSFGATGVFGLWLGTSRADHVIVERDATPGHRRHIALHEIGHVVFDHGDDPGDGTLGQELTTLVGADLGPDARARTGYGTASEYEAELFASIVEDWAGRMTAHRPRDGSVLRQAYDRPWGWR